jgi:hypothetical protein
MKKYLIYLASLILLSILYNPSFLYWHFWIKWQDLYSSEELYFKPLIKKTLQITEANPLWKTYDFLEFNMNLPQVPLAMRSVFDNGIEMEFCTFSWASISLLAGENADLKLDSLHKSMGVDKLPAPFSFYNTSVQTFRLTPKDINYFSGSENTSIVIMYLLHKAALFQNIEHSFVFELPKTKGIYLESANDRNLLFVFSKNETKFLVLTLLFNAEERVEKDKVLYRLINGINFSNYSANKSEIKNKIIEITREKN